MKPAAFIEYLRKAFGQKADLPIAVWYSDEPLSATEKAGGCIFKHLDAIDRGATVSLDGDNTGCGGGKFYCGFSDEKYFFKVFKQFEDITPSEFKGAFFKKKEVSQ